MHVLCALFFLRGLRAGGHATSIRVVVARAFGCPAIAAQRQITPNGNLCVSLGPYDTHNLPAPTYAGFACTAFTSTAVERMGCVGGPAGPDGQRGGGHVWG